MIHNILSKIRYKHIIILIVSTIIIFNSKIGIQNLNPTNIDWLMQGGDWPQHQLGFEFYRKQPFTLPIGKIQNFLYPVTTNIAFTDSIPLLAIPFKLINFILTKNFQYFGLWLFFNIFMQGYLAYIIFRKLNFTKQESLLSGLLLQLTPALLARINHPALTAHWLILFAFYNYLNFKQDKKSIFYNLLLVIIVSLIHPYLVAMIIPITFITLLKTKSISTKITATIATIILPIFIWYIIGYFVTYSVGDPNNLGLFSANSNTFFNPQYALMNDNLYNSSNFLDILNQKYKSQYEGFAYLGLGVLISSLLVLIKFLYLIPKSKYNFSTIQNLIKNHLLFILITSGITFYSILNLDFINRLRQFENIIIIEYFLKASSMLRANGRFIWVFMYIIIIFTIYLLHKFYKKQFIYLILIIISIQIIDLKPLLNNKLFYNNDNFTLNSEQNLFWQDKIKGAKAIYFYPGGKRTYKKDDDYISFSYFASKSNIPINAGYLSRYDLPMSMKFNLDLEQKLSNNILEDNILYITNAENSSLFYQIAEKTNQEVGVYDGYYYIK